jgi:predicted nucleotidyltransferase
VRVFLESDRRVVMAATLRVGVRAALDLLKAGLAEIYGDRLAGLVLYGSQARGDAREDSDVDVAVVLRGDRG